MYRKLSRLIGAVLALTGVSMMAAVRADAAAAVTKPNEQQRCSMISPNENGKANPELGISKGDLRRLASTSELNYKWVQWYIGLSNSMDEVLASAAPDFLRARIPKMAKCESVETFKNVINQGLYDLPKLECIGGDFNYRFRVIGENIDMELVQKVAAPADSVAGVTYVRPVAREPVDFTSTSGIGCQLRITQKRQNQRALKICLPGAHLAGDGSGGVSMNEGGKPLPETSRQVECHADAEFAASAKPLIKTESAPGAPAPAVNSAAPAPTSGAAHASQ